MIAFALCTLGLVTACNTEDFVKLVQSSPERAAKMVVERGNLYCQLPLETRLNFREKVQEAAKENGGYFVKEEITCEGD